jgi:hypothetical protein
VKTNLGIGRWAGISAAVLLVTLAGWQQASATEAPGSNGVAIAIVYDTSGSMQQKVRDADGKLTPKSVIAERALKAVLDRLEAAAGPNGSRLPMETGLVVFHGKDDRAPKRAGFAVKLGRFDPQAIRTWLAEHGKPKAGTPLGEAVELAGKAVVESKLPRKHVLVITDGINTLGPDPTETLPRVQKLAAQRQTTASFHFVAFDVNAAEFAGVKKLGATVVGAADEKQLNSQLEFILEKKILLEDEEAPSPKPKTN